MRLPPIADVSRLTGLAEELCIGEYGRVMTFSKKVFIPLTKLCRDVCHYCTFAKPPRAGEPAYMTLDEVLAIAEAGRDAGCKEALFTLGDKPERRYGAARRCACRTSAASPHSIIWSVAPKPCFERRVSCRISMPA